MKLEEGRHYKSGDGAAWRCDHYWWRSGEYGVCCIAGGGGWELGDRDIWRELRADGTYAGSRGGINIVSECDKNGNDLPKKSPMKLRYSRGPRACYRHSCEECRPDLSERDVRAIREMRDMIARIEGGEIHIDLATLESWYEHGNHHEQLIITTVPR